MKTKLLIFLSCSIAILVSCKKTTETLQLDGGSINVTNAIIGGSSLNMMGTNNLVTATNSISLNNFAILPLMSGQHRCDFGTPATTPGKLAVVYFSQSLTVNNTSNYSLFLTGTSLSAVDNVLIKEKYQQTYADSVCGVRFINLSPGNPISVNIKGNSNGTEAANLAYKSYNDFKQYPAKRVNVSYVFEFRDAALGTLLTSYTMPTPYFHNVTLCFRGKAGAYGVIKDNDF